MNHVNVYTGCVLGAGCFTFIWKDWFELEVDQYIALGIVSPRDKV